MIVILEHGHQQRYNMDKDSKEYQLQMAIQLTDFVDYFIENGATKEDVKKMFVEIVDLIYVDKENLK